MDQDVVRLGKGCFALSAPFRQRTPLDVVTFPSATRAMDGNFNGRGRDERNHQAWDGPRVRTGRSRSCRYAAPALATLVVMASTLVVVLTPAPAGVAPVSFTNSTTIAIPSTGDGDPSRRPRLALSVAHHGVRPLGEGAGRQRHDQRARNHASSADVEVMLVGPSGSTVVLMTDAGGNNNVGGATFTLDDALRHESQPHRQRRDLQALRPRRRRRRRRLARAGTGGSRRSVAVSLQRHQPERHLEPVRRRRRRRQPRGHHRWMDDRHRCGLRCLSRLPPARFGHLHRHRRLWCRHRHRQSGRRHRRRRRVSFATASAPPPLALTTCPSRTIGSFADGQTSRTVQLPITDDPLVEGIDELVAGPSTSTGGATLGTPTSAGSGSRTTTHGPMPPRSPSRHRPTIGAADPYPSSVVVAGANGVVTDVDVTLTGSPTPLP